MLYANICVYFDFRNNVEMLDPRNTHKNSLSDMFLWKIT